MGKVKRAQTLSEDYGLFLPWTLSQGVLYPLKYYMMTEVIKSPFKFMTAQTNLKILKIFQTLIKNKSQKLF